MGSIPRLNTPCYFLFDYRGHRSLKKPYSTIAVKANSLQEEDYNLYLLKQELYRIIIQCLVYVLDMSYSILQTLELVQQNSKHKISTLLIFRHIDGNMIIIY